jgi:hypothetical protein
MSKQKINIIKIPKNSNQVNKQVEFPRMPRMYLELIENKDKIKPNLVNKEYDPDDASTIITEMNQDYQDLHIEESEINNNIIMEESEINEDEELQDNTSDNSSIKEDKSVSSSSVSLSEEEKNEETESEKSLSLVNSNIDDLNVDNEENSNISEEKSINIENSIQDSTIQNSTIQNSNVYNNNIIESSIKTIDSIEKSKKTVIKPQNEKLREILKNPPKLSELEKNGFVKSQKTIPNLTTVADNLEAEDELKRELLYKFDLLKRSYKNVEIPEFSIHSDFKNMNKIYENTLRRVSLDNNVANYKNYMIAGFMLIEYVLSAWFKFDMNGFTQQQIINMNQYERLLIELGEKSYVPTNKQWPVELRLLGMILLNAVIFIIARIIIKKTGTNLFGLINTAQSEVTNVPTKKRKMKGPNLDLESIPDIE